MEPKQTRLKQIRSWVAPLSPENAKSNSGTLDLVMSISIENLSQEIAILLSRFSMQLLSCNSSGFWAFDGPRSTPWLSARLYKSTNIPISSLSSGHNDHSHRNIKPSAISSLWNCSFFLAPLRMYNKMNGFSLSGNSLA
jgi:hypothetical protein